MAIRIQFGYQSVIEPGSYGRTVNGTTQNPTVASFGKTTIIDTGSGAYFGGGAGVNGELTQGKNTIYEFTDKNVFKDFVKGGVLWDIADFLFKPSKNGNGVPALQIIRASTTTAPAWNLTFAGSGNITKTGTITTSSSSASVTGSGTKFLSELRAGDILKTSGNTVIGTVLSIASDTALTFVANAASTNSAIAFKGQYAQTQGGTLTIKSLSEGFSGNGYLNSAGTLLKGYGLQLVSGTLDPNKFVLKFLVGTYRGVNNLEPTFNVSTWLVGTTYTIGQKVYRNGFVFQSVTNSNTGNDPLADTNSTNWSLQDYSDVYGDGSLGSSAPKTVIQSPEFLSLNDLISWANSNNNFLSFFKITTSAINGSGYIDSVDLASYSNVIVASGGTESYGSGDLDAVLANIVEEDNTFFLLDNYGVNAKSVNNAKVVSFTQTTSQFGKFCVVGGGYGSSNFTGTNGSLDIANYYNTKRLITVHDGVVKSKLGGGQRNYCSLYTAALYLGRTAGLEPQVPSTWKDLDISNPVAELNKGDREKALMGGVVHMKYVGGLGWVINQSINSMQKNGNLIDANGDSYEVSIERINAQLIKELVLNSQVLFVGGNYSTASATDVKLFTENYLTFRTVINGKDNLIMSFQDVTVKLIGDAWDIQFGYVPNGPINKLFFTGTTLSANLSA